VNPEGIFNPEGKFNPEGIFNCEHADFIELRFAQVDFPAGNRGL